MVKGTKSLQQLREEKLPADRIRFKREELPGLSEELENIYNVMATAGREPSEKVQRLILWVKQETAVMNDPEYDPDFTCEACGYGKDDK